jgi:hypothetical protein
MGIADLAGHGKNKLLTFRGRACGLRCLAVGSTRWFADVSVKQGPGAEFFFLSSGPRARVEARPMASLRFGRDCICMRLRRFVCSVWFVAGNRRKASVFVLTKKRKKWKARFWLDISLGNDR